jgi:hypothetical protein
MTVLTSNPDVNKKDADGAAMPPWGMIIILDRTAQNPG